MVPKIFKIGDGTKKKKKITYHNRKKRAEKSEKRSRSPNVDRPGSLALCFKYCALNKNKI